MRGLTVGLLVILLPYLFSRLASNWNRVSIHQLEDLEARADKKATRNVEFAKGFRIVSYNIAHGRGLAESNRDGGNRQERKERLDSIGTLLREVDADVVVLNEVDFDASWSFGENQARYLAEKANYPYWVEQRNYDFRVLFWTWRFGNAVLSRHPIQNAKLLPLPASAQWESWLVGKKQGVLCEMEIKGQPIQLIATHLESRSEDTRVESVKAVLKILGKSNFDQSVSEKSKGDSKESDKTALSQSELPTFLVGDLNSTPTHFPNSSVDTNNENAINLLDVSGSFQRLPDQMPDEDDMTYHSDGPDRVIDWILIPKDWQFQRFVVHPSTLSDHRLIFSDVSL